jgi:NAD(P)-dependent dehydrogenase (short-subunit alcohol dehydrogenase family)
MGEPEDRVAIVTGATQGLGLAIAQAFAQAGTRVVLAGIDDAAGHAAAQALGAAAHYVHADITSDEEVDACVAATLARFGRLDILVNNACIYEDAGLDSTRSQWLQTLNVNLVSAAIFAQRAARVMPGSGVIVNLGSTGGKTGAAGRATYPASKAGLIQITRNIARTLGPRGIRCLSVSPGWTWSPAMERMSGGSLDKADAVGAPLHPLGRVGRAEEVAAAVLFACSAQASWMTGVDLPVDGGFSSLGPDQGRSPRDWFAASSPEG